MAAMRSGLLLSIAVLLSLGGGAAAHAQQAAPGVRAEIVRLDVVVTDADGKLVRDLQREDFQLLEDGKPQADHAIPRREAARLRGARGRPCGPRGSLDSDARSAGGPGGRVRSRRIARRAGAVRRRSSWTTCTSPPATWTVTKEALHRFVAESLGPEDKVAIVTSSGPGGVQQLTQRPRRCSERRSIASPSGRRTSPRPGARR